MIEIETLMKLGLNRYQAKVYIALIQRPVFTASELAEVADIPRARVYDTLESLIDLGFCSKLPGTILRFVAAHPRDAIETLLREQERRAEQARALADELTTIFEESRGEQDPLDYIEVLRDNSQINQRLARFENESIREILIFTKPPFSTAMAENDAGLEALRRGVRVRSLYEKEILQDPASVADIARFVTAGEEARFVDRLPLKLAIFDLARVILPLQDPIPDRISQTALVIHHPSLARTLAMAFDVLWQEASSYNGEL
jgi:sugar-specific transcriptional regulator TrmB